MKVPRQSKNDVKIEHLAIASRQVKELIAAGVTENLAILSIGIQH